MTTEIREKNVLIAERVPVGDRWKLIQYNSRTFEQDPTIYESLTDALNAYFMAVENKPKAYRLEPQNSKLYAVVEEEVDITPTIKHYNIYGDPIK
jgi:hypothetical protein